MPYDQVLCAIIIAGMLGWAAGKHWRDCEWIEAAKPPEKPYREGGWVDWIWAQDRRFYVVEAGELDHARFLVTEMESSRRVRALVRQEGRQP